MPNVFPRFQDDRELYEALLRRDDRAFDYLYAELAHTFRHWVIQHNGTGMDAEDAFQKGLLKFLINLENGNYQHQAGTRITTVVFDYCKKTWLTEAGSYRFRNRASLSDASDPADTADVVEEMQRAAVVEIMKQALLQLKDDCRRVIDWFYIDEMPLREIAEKLNMRETSVKSKRYDCTEKLKGIYRQLATKRGL